MTALELRQAVVFAARFEWATQRFVRTVGGKVEEFDLTELERTGAVQGIDLGLRGVTPLPNPARVRDYWADVLPPGAKPWDFPEHWCGALCLFCIHRAELGLDVFWKAGFASRVLRQLEPGELPEPGDVAYFHRYQHHAIVESVDSLRETFESVDGNQAPGIQRRTRPLKSAAAFYSLEPLLAKAA